MEKTTLASGAKILNLIVKKRATVETLEYLAETGILSDILEMNVDSLKSKYQKIDELRWKIQSALLLHPQIEVLPGRYILKVEHERFDPLDFYCMEVEDIYGIESEIVPWGFTSQFTHFPTKFKTKYQSEDEAVEFRLVKLIRTKGWRPAYERKIALLGAGWVYANFMDLVSFAPYLRKERFSLPVVALGSEIKGSFDVYDTNLWNVPCYPTLKFSNDSVIFDPIGMKDILGKPSRKEFLYLVRYKDR